MVANLLFFKAHCQRRGMVCQLWRMLQQPPYLTRSLCVQQPNSAWPRQQPHSKMDKGQNKQSKGVPKGRWEKWVCMLSVVSFWEPQIKPTERCPILTASVTQTARMALQTKVLEGIRPTEAVMDWLFKYKLYNYLGNERGSFLSN